MAAELRNGIEVGLLCRWRQIADHHVVDHAPAQRADLSHRKLLSDEVVQQPNPVGQETPASAVPYCEAVSFNGVADINWNARPNHRNTYAGSCRQLYSTQASRTTAFRGQLELGTEGQIPLPPAISRR